MENIKKEERSQHKNDFPALGPYAWKINEECHKHGVPPIYAFRLIMVESEGNWKAIHRNDDGSLDIGLFQLNNKTFPQYISIFDIPLNIELGVAFMADCYKRAGNWYDALLLYNCGRIHGAPVESHRYAQMIIGGGRDNK